MKENLEVPFTEAEIFKAVSEKGNPKSPDPDGLTSKFFLKNVEHREV